MANRAHLLVSPTEAFWDPEALAYVRGTRSLAGSAWKIPPLWYSLFVVTDFRELRYIEGEDEIAWPCLTSPLGVASRHTRECRSTFVSVFPGEVHSLYDQWTAYFERLAATHEGYVHLKTYDISELHDNEWFHSYLVASVQAFTLNLQDDWFALLNESELRFEPGPPIRVFTESGPQGVGGILCGYSEEPDPEWPGGY